MSDRLRPADAAWLHMEQPTNLMTITGLLVFEERLERQELESVATRLRQHDRFCCRVDETLGGPRWTRAPWRPERHLHELELSTQGSLMEVVSELMSTPLERDRPLWQLHLLQLPRGSALVIRVHHALGDGVALMHVLGSLAEPREPEPCLAHGRTRPGWRQLAAGLWGLVNGVLLRPEPPTPFHGPLGQRKRAAVSGALPLDEIKRVGRALGATVNDVLLTCLTGALRACLGEQVPADLTIRAVMPVDLRASLDERLGNRFGLVFVPLPVGLTAPRERLAACKRVLDRLKRSPQAGVIYAILQLAGRLPIWGERVLVNIFGARATAVATNVPGPRRPLVLAGRRLRDLMFWVPQSGRLGLGLSVISYAGAVRVGVAADAHLLPDPSQLVEGFEGTFRELQTLVAGGQHARVP